MNRNIPRVRCAATDATENGVLRCSNVYPSDKAGHKGLHSHGDHLWGVLNEADLARRARRQQFVADRLAAWEVEEATGRRRVECDAGAPFPQATTLQLEAVRATTPAAVLALASRLLSERCQQAGGRTEDGWYYGFSDAAEVVDELAGVYA